jgi:Type VI secretion system/phage-baseplate injector OB domain
MNNFLGKDGFNWWYGVVEDTNDPLKTGRVRVRIFGYHTDNLQELPTSGLPWAQPTLSPSNSKTFSPPRLGDYVMGFFSDGESAQAPVLMGVFPGFETSYDKSKGFSPQSNLKPATPPSGQIQYQVGQPTIAPLARGQVANTAISQANSNLAHVCDIPAGIKFEIAKLTISVSGLINTLRTTIEGLWASTASSPFADEIRNAIKTIKAKIKQIQKFIRDQLEPLQDIQKFIQSLRDLIEYIATLPARIAAFLKQCLSEATKGISDAINVGKDIAKEIEGIRQDQLAVVEDAKLAIENSKAQSPMPNFERP